jgi:hypothetical protein
MRLEKVSLLQRSVFYRFRKSILFQPKSRAFVTDGSIYIRIADLTEREFSQFDAMDDACAMMKDKFPALRAAVQGVQGVRGAGGRAQAVVLNVRGPDLKELQKYCSAGRCEASVFAS